MQASRGTLSGANLAATMLPKGGKSGTKPLLAANLADIAQLQRIAVPGQHLPP